MLSTLSSTTSITSGFFRWRLLPQIIWIRTSGSSSRNLHFQAGPPGYSDTHYSWKIPEEEISVSFWGPTYPSHLRAFPTPYCLHSSYIGLQPPPPPQGYCSALLNPRHKCHLLGTPSRICPRWARLTWIHSPCSLHISVPALLTGVNIGLVKSCFLLISPGNVYSVRAGLLPVTCLHCLALCLTYIVLIQQQTHKLYLQVPEWFSATIW